MQTVTISAGNAIKAWNNANAENKKLIEDLVGEEVVKPKNIMERISNFDDVLAIAGKEASEFSFSAGETDDELAYRQAKLIAFVYNGNKVASLEETRYYPWGKLQRNAGRPSGFALSYIDFGHWHSHSAVGVRLCFSNPDHAEDAFKKFTSIYERLQIN